MNEKTGGAVLSIAFMILLASGFRVIAQKSAWEIGPRTLPPSE